MLLAPVTGFSFSFSFDESSSSFVDVLKGDLIRVFELITTFSLVRCFSALVADEEEALAEIELLLRLKIMGCVDICFWRGPGLGTHRVQFRKKD